MILQMLFFYSIPTISSVDWTSVTSIIENKGYVKVQTYSRRLIDVKQHSPLADGTCGPKKNFKSRHTEKKN
jgi:hypothetical protein